MVYDGKDKKKGNAGVSAVAAEKKKAEPAGSKYPPLEAAARRLERLFGGTGSNSNAAAAASQASLPIQPAKILKKWMGSSSGAAGSATFAQIASCAERTLNPGGKCATGRDLLLGLATAEERLAVPLELRKKEEGESEKKEGKGPDAMEEDSKDDSEPRAAYLDKGAREVESWLIALAVRLKWRAKDYQSAYDWSEKGLKVLDAHLSECDAAGGAGGGMHPLLARALRYRSLCLESLAPEARSAIVAGQRPELAGRHTMAVLRRDADVSATVLNIMLRDLLEGDQVEQAQKLLSNCNFPTERASNNQLVRYLYYSGRIQALRLEYTRAYSNLSQALRKSPTNTALGFRIAAQRLLVVVQLLMGEIPERSVFFGEGMKVELKPYLEIAQAVRRGDLAVFHSTVSTHADRLRLDGTYTLISRLAHSVVKAGLRRLKASYSRISLTDVAGRLGLPSATSAEFVVAKAVRDGVIDATIDHEGGFVQSHDLVDVYATIEPSEAFHRRIAYCLTTHNDAVRAMRYTPDAYKRQLEASRGLGRRGRNDDDDRTDEEKAKDLEDELDEDY